MDQTRSDSSLRGPLCQGFWSALSNGGAVAVANRVGPGTVHLPGALALSGAALTPALQTLSARLKAESAHFEHERTLRSAGRDGAVGVLWLGDAGARKPLRTLVVSEKRPDRRIDLRVYLPTDTLTRGSAETLPNPDVKEATAATGLARELSWALEMQDFAAFQKLFEVGALYESKEGERVPNENLLQFFERLVALGLRVTSSMDADDFALVEAWSTTSHTRTSVLAQRGGSGLFATLRVFGNA